MKKPMKGRAKGGRGKKPPMKKKMAAREDAPGPRTPRVGKGPRGAGRIPEDMEI